jgi:hypothetical protein
MARFALIKSFAGLGRTLLVAIPALAAALALLASQVTTVQVALDHLWNLWFSRHEIVIRDFTEIGSIQTEEFGFSAAKRGRAPVILATTYDYHMKYDVLIDKKSVPEIDNCKGQLSGLTQDANFLPLESPSESLPRGRYDKEMHYQFIVKKRASKAGPLFFRIVCEGVITNWRQTDKPVPAEHSP